MKKCAGEKIGVRVSAPHTIKNVCNVPVGVAEKPHRLTVCYIVDIKIYVTRIFDDSLETPQLVLDKASVRCTQVHTNLDISLESIYHHTSQWTTFTIINN